jgi:hypothetical protein
MYVCRRLNLGRIRKDIDNPGATWEPCRTLTVSMSHEESSRPELVVLSSEEFRQRLRPRSNTEPWSPVMAYLPSGDRMDSTRASGIPVHTLTKILILNCNVRRHGGTLQHPVHSGNHGIAFVHDHSACTNACAH